MEFNIFERIELRKIMNFNIKLLSIYFFFNLTQFNELIQSLIFLFMYNKKF